MAGLKGPTRARKGDRRKRQTVKAFRPYYPDGNRLLSEPRPQVRRGSSCIPPRNPWRTHQGWHHYHLSTLLGSSRGVDQNVRQ